MGSVGRLLKWNSSGVWSSSAECARSKVEPVSLLVEFVNDPVAVRDRLLMSLSIAYNC